MEATNLLWVFACSALVMCMQIGFCMLESGLVRSKNTINVALKNLIDFVIASLLFWAFAYGLMFGASAGWFGTNGFFFSPAEHSSNAQNAFFLFQMMFCATAATIVSGAVAERMRFGGYLLVTVLISGVLYPIAGGWAWNPSGWLKSLGFVDFAGSTVVHSMGGWMALAATIVIGPRLGRFDSRLPLANPHSLVTSTVGVLVLFVAWLGFNGGSTLALDHRVGMILVNTVLAGCAGCLSAMGAVWYFQRLPLLPETLNGCVAGLVAITAGCHAVSPVDAVFIGAVGGLISYGAVHLLAALKIDDVVGASAAHAIPGVWGTLAVALFGDLTLLGTGLSRMQQVGVQALGAVVFFLCAFGLGWLLLMAINRVFPLRITEDGERIGLNVAEHGASTEIVDLLSEMSRHSTRGDFTTKLDFQPHTEVGQIAAEYNKVIGKVSDEMDMREIFARRLEQEREALDASQRKIISSIEYARRIQESILPRPETLERMIPEHFVIYKPRDIVSGDFYWCLAREESFYLAVIDCTGHGVPGAFMSMMSFVLLQQIVIERGANEPADILSRLHSRVRAALGQNSPGNDNKDGMDAALIRIDPDKIVFAGAGLPLCWVDGSSGTPLYGEIRGDRHGLGGGAHLPAQIQYIQHKVPRTKDLSIYLFSDGLIHQPNHLRRPFDKSGLRHLALSLHGTPMPRQGAEIAAQLEAFRGGAVQRDDITLIGVNVSAET